MSDRNESEREAAYLNPARVFDSPEDVVEYAALSRDEKVEILRRWSYDAAQLAVAEDEGMGGGEANLTDRIHQALRDLGVDLGAETSGLTRHGSIPAPPRRE